MLRNLVGSGHQFLDTPYVGVLGRDVPTFGDDGGSVLNNEITLPGEGGDFFRAVLKTAPASGTLTFNMDGSGSLVGAAQGTWYLEYYVYKNDQLATDLPGYGVATFEIGVSVTPISVAITPAIESDSSPGITFFKTKAISPAIESDLSIPIAGSTTGGGITLAIAPAIEVDQAQDVTKKALHGITPDDIAAIADAVYAKLVAAGDIARINEVWQRLGLDSTNPTINRTDGSYEFASVVVTASADPSGNITQTRQ